MSKEGSHLVVSYTDVKFLGSLLVLSAVAMLQQVVSFVCMKEEGYLFVVDVEGEQLFVHLYNFIDRVSSILSDQGWADAVLVDAVKGIRLAIQGQLV